MENTILCMSNITYSYRNNSYFFFESIKILFLAVEHESQYTFSNTL